MPAESDPSELTTNLHRYEQKYRSGDLRGHACPGAVLQVIAGPVVAVAPHAIAHRRDGRTKAAEFYTGAITELCVEELGWSAVAALRTYDDREVPNPVEQSVRAVVAATAAAWLVEIHGMRAEWQVDVSIGTAAHEAASAKAEELSVLLSERFVTRIDDPFNGGSSLSSRIRPTLGITSALHLELGPRLRSDTTSDGDLRHLLESLGAVLS